MSTSILSSVTFGNPQPGGTICVGKGFCQVSSSTSGQAAQALIAGTPAPIPVTFQVSPIDKSVLIMSFSLTHLKKNQPDQVPFFTHESGEYNFEATHHFTHEVFGGLEFHPNPRIEPKNKNKVHIAGDLVTMFITYSHD